MNLCKPKEQFRPKSIASIKSYFVPGGLLWFDELLARREARSSQTAWLGGLSFAKHCTRHHAGSLAVASLAHATLGGRSGTSSTSQRVSERRMVLPSRSKNVLAIVRAALILVATASITSAAIFFFLFVSTPARALGCTRCRRGSQGLLGACCLASAADQLLPAPP